MPRPLTIIDEGQRLAAVQKRHSAEEGGALNLKGLKFMTLEPRNLSSSSKTRSISSKGSYKSSNSRRRRPRQLFKTMQKSLVRKKSTGRFQDDYDEMASKTKDQIISELTQMIEAHHKNQMTQTFSLDILRNQVRQASQMLNELIDERNTNESEALDVIQQQNKSIDLHRS